MVTARLFNRNPVVTGEAIEQPPQELVRSTLSLYNASLEDAVKYGGDLTRAALSVMKFKGDRKHIVVDTKVHMLMEGMIPAIPGWHTDGVPRQENGAPSGGPPMIWMQEPRYGLNPPRFYLLVTGEGCLTEFYTEPNVLIENPDHADPKLYEMMTAQVEKKTQRYPYNRAILTLPSCTVGEWDWWNIHRGPVATKNEWRFLIRVAETDYQEPVSDLRKVIRTQQQVYCPTEFGW